MRVKTDVKCNKLVYTFIVFVLCAGPLQADEGISGTRPNIVLIYADDMGYDAVSAYNDEMGMDTPNIDRLTRQGMMFTDAHSTSAVCSPSRYSLLTGRYHWRTRLKSFIVGKWERPLIKDERLTMPELVQQAGYDTAMFGKWHLGWNWPAKNGGTTSDPDRMDFDDRVTGGPVDHGFDYYFGDDVPNWPPYAWRENDLVLGEITTTMDEWEMKGVREGPAAEDWSFEAVLPELTERSVAYIRERSEKEKPFFLYFSMTSPHVPFAVSDRFRGKTGITTFTDWLYETDWAVGRLLEVLKQSGQAENTLVIFTADNGTPGNAELEKHESKGVHLRHHWRGEKADVYEGGHRVPFVVRWPGQVEPGTRADQVISQVDVMATLADVTEQKLPPDAGEDSVSLLPLLKNPSREKPLHDAVVCHSVDGYYAVRMGNWKASFCRGSGSWHSPTEKETKKRGLPPVQLYNLDQDPKETNNLQKKHPGRVKKMRSWLRDVVERGRSTPGPEQSNHKGKTSWPHLPWHPASE